MQIANRRIGHKEEVEEVKQVINSKKLRGWAHNNDQADVKLTLQLSTEISDEIAIKKITDPET